MPFSIHHKNVDKKIQFIDRKNLLYPIKCVFGGVGGDSTEIEILYYLLCSRLTASLTESILVDSGH